MAYKLELPSSYFGMKFIWNISDHVGDSPTCPNKATDVDLVALLLGGAIRAMDLGKNIHKSCHQAFQVNGQMDVNIAYWIRIANHLHKKKLDQAESGILSRAKKSTFNNGDTWSIVKINYTMFLGLRDTWEKLPDHPQCPAILRTELLTKTSP